MAYFVSSQTLQGYDPTDENIQIVKYHFEVDTESDIPTQNQFSAQNVKISMTSTAHVIQNNTNWEMKSDGTWVKQTSSGGDGGTTPTEAINLEQGDNLNNITTPGVYYNNPVLTQSDLINSPTSEGFRMEVDYLYSNSTIIQKLYPATADVQFFRVYEGGWTIWMEYNTLHNGLTLNFSDE